MPKKMLLLLACAGLPRLLPAQPVLLKDYRPLSSLVVPVTRVPKARFPAIDFHAHSAFNGSTKEAVDKWVRLMDDSGVETAIVYTDAVGAEFDRQAGLFLSYGKRFQVYCTFDNTGIDAPDYRERVVRELERCYREGARGVGELSDKGWGLEGGMAAYMAAKNSGGKRAGPPRSQRLHLDDPRLDPFWEKRAQLNLPVSLHVADHPSCWQPLGPTQERPPQYDALNLYGQDVPSYGKLLAMRDRVLARHPHTEFVAVHLSNLQGPERGNWISPVAWPRRRCRIDVELPARKPLHLHLDRIVFVALGRQIVIRLLQSRLRSQA